MYTFQIKQKDRSSILSSFHILIALIFIFDLTHVKEEGTKDWVFSAVYIIGAIFLFMSAIFSGTLLKELSRHLGLLLFESVMVLGGSVYFWGKGASWVALSHAILSVVIIIFWVYLKRREHGEKITITDKNIILPGFPTDRIVEWNQLSNLIKKYDLLTIDFRNNRIIQVQVVNIDEVEENEFNQFCQQQINMQNK